jgi:3-phosphoshikimate 1-carboxyvinyltransferase
MRFLPPVSALALGPTTFDGDAGARRRPMSVTISSLRALGVDIADEGRGALPFTLHGTGRVAGGELTIDASSSSQFVSGLLLSAARFENGIDLRHSGERLPSIPHIDMTLDVLRAHGVEASSPEPGRWVVKPGAIAGGAVDNLGRCAEIDAHGKHRAFAHAHAFVFPITWPEPFGLVMIDLDQFKAVNDTLGHNFGDRLLRHVASTIEQSLRSTDTVGVGQGGAQPGAAKLTVRWLNGPPLKV